MKEESLYLDTSVPSAYYDRRAKERQYATIKFWGAPLKPEENHRLLRLFSQEIEDWPEKITPSFTCFEKTLQFKLQDELGKDFFDIAIESCRTKYFMARNSQALKNPIIIQEILTKAKTESRKSVTLEQIVENIVALKKSAEAHEGNSYA